MMGAMRCVTWICLIQIICVTSITLNPLQWIQGESASLTCTTATANTSIVIITKDFVPVTTCILTTPCNIDGDPSSAPVKYNYNRYYTVSQTSNNVTINIANVSKDRDDGEWKCENPAVEMITVDVKVESPTSTGLNFGLIIGIIVCVGVVILIIILVVVLYKRRKRVNKKDGHDKEYAPNVHNHVTTTRQGETNAVVHYSAGEIKKDGTSTCTQVSQLKKTAETKPNPELLYATVNKTKTDETMKKGAQSKKPDIKSKKSNVKPTQINGKPNEKMTTKGDANENVGIFSNNHGMATSQYENHLIQKAKAETFKKKGVVYADLDFDGHHPTTAVRGQVNAVEYNGIDYTKRGPTQPTPPNSSDEEADNDK